MMPTLMPAAHATSPLMVVAIAHAALAVVCAISWAIDLPPIGGAHPAIKPLKFAVSIAILLGSMHFVLAALAVDARAKAVIAWALAGTMVIEMTLIAIQALRGEASHFNVKTPGDALVWRVMAGAIVVASLALLATAVLASIRPLALPPRLAVAVQVGLWLLLLVAISGFAMGGRGAHSVGGADGGAGLAITGWSRTHGDLRVPHFFALHGLQALPLVAIGLERLPWSERARWLGLAACALAWVAASIGTLVQALAGRPVWPSS
jgi:hypothetical protein